jgi:hypothetical protein
MVAVTGPEPASYVTRTRDASRSAEYTSAVTGYGFDWSSVSASGVWTISGAAVQLTAQSRMSARRDGSVM